MADRLGVDRVTVAVGEDRVATIDPVPVATLHTAPTLEHLLGAGVDVDAVPTGARLHRDLGGATAAAESGELTTAHAGVCSEMERRAEPEVRFGGERYGRARSSRSSFAMDATGVL